MSIKIIPNFFSGRDREGDFGWMLSQSEYADSLFIFNDDIESYFDMIGGAGNAIIRPFKYTGRVWGIPTGSLDRGGDFLELNEESKKWIDLALSDIQNILANNESIKRVFYSASLVKDDVMEISDAAESKTVPMIGIEIFEVGKDVREYITKGIYQLATTLTEQ